MISGKKKFFFNAFIIIFSIIIGLIFSECIVRIVSPQNLSGSWRQEDPTGLMVNKNRGQARHQLNDRVVTYSFGKYFNRSFGKEDDVKEKILFLGDSFTFGWLLEDSSTFLSKIQNTFSDYQIINSAAGGWGASDYTRFIENYCNVIKPKLIVIMINSDDVGRAWKSHLYKVNENNDLISVNLKSSMIKQIINIIPGYQYFLEHSHLAQLLRVFLISKGGRESNKNQIHNGQDTYQEEPRTLGLSSQELIQSQDLAKKLFIKISNLVQDCKTSLVVINLGWAKEENYFRLEPTAMFLQSADFFFREAGINYYSLSPYLKKIHENKSLFVIQNDHHPNEAGADIIAQGLITLLGEKVITKKFKEKIND